MCRDILWLAIGLHTVQWTDEACLAAAGHMYCEFGCRSASYRALTVLEACIETTEHCRGCVSGGLRREESKWDIQSIPMRKYILLDVYCKA